MRRKTHMIVKATHGWDWFPTACGIRDTGVESFKDGVAEEWHQVTCSDCKKARRKLTQTADGAEK